MRTLLLVVVVTLIAGCPSADNNVVCGAAGACPRGTACSCDHICWPPGEGPLCDAGGSTGGSGGATSGGSTAQASTTTSAASSTPGSSSGGGTSGSSSRGTTTALAGSTGGFGCSGGALPPRVLATLDSFQGSVWDLTNPAAAMGLIGGGHLLSDIPTAIAETVDQEILVLLDSNGLVAFDGAGNYVGEIVVPVPSGEFPGGTGLAYVPQPCGADPVVVVCGDQMTAFRYGGRGDFGDAGTVQPTAIYSNMSGGFGACVPGPDDTFFASNGVEQILWYDVLTGNPHTGGPLAQFAQSQGQVNGLALDAAGDVLAVGDDGDGNGFAALFNGSGECLEARGGSSCTLTCQNGCAAGETALVGIPLWAAAFFNGMFLATASTVNPGAMNTILQLDPENALAVGDYYVGVAQAQYYGLFAAPQPQ